MPPGRHPWIPDKKMIEEAGIMYGQGMTLEQIANYFGISYQTLNERKNEIPDFADALKKGKGKMDAFVTGKLFKQIQRDNLILIIFYLKCKMGWKESQVLEHQGKDGAPIQVESEIKLSAKQTMDETMDSFFKQLPNKE